ncbi:carboxymuconolactone decarboxylase family protein [Leptolyngbya sp. FACHB-541]|uniref:carboxymuconolactone decarboxylase family protein n=1 Tax=Leptolyngbya sp. FACHB-541 TaxID=2692810 RepID=UPI0016879CC8|nr:carboxymuconolactone decarboxylase family protein [Leptolyngbya sp. FACHB-541]MBD2001285.1 carboxymuconolactone decarboxylase family protein [Leptolyngbya sp. FACHB-541]
MTRAEIEKQFIERFGSIPSAVQTRLEVAEATGRLEALSALEAFRKITIDESPLTAKIQRLVHFGMTLAIAEDEAIAAHALSAHREGASLSELVGVCESAAIVLGMPAYTRGMRAVSKLLESES